MLKAIAYLERRYGSRNHLRVRVFQAGAGVNAVIFEDRNVRDARIKTELIVAGLINM